MKCARPTHASVEVHRGFYEGGHIKELSTCSSLNLIREKKKCPTR